MSKVKNVIKDLLLYTSTILLIGTGVGILAHASFKGNEILNKDIKLIAGGMILGAAMILLGILIFGRKPEKENPNKFIDSHSRDTIKQQQQIN